MSQEAVERFLGRLVTDQRFCRWAADSIELACRQEGYDLSPTELRLLAGAELGRVVALADLLHPALCRAGGDLVSTPVEVTVLGPHEGQ